MGRITTLLVANRGEIAVRIMRTARELGIQTVAVFSDDDLDAPHVHAADWAIHLPGSTARETYLDHELLLTAAARAGADAVHPGYGFLSEEHKFAGRCEEAGLTFVGPSSAVIRQMALKDAAKDVAARAGVPVLDSIGVSDEDEGWVAQASTLGYPVIVKAVAGGGGRGMHVASDDAGLREAVKTARREAASLFGSDEVIVERYLPSPRHVEIQVIGDSHGAAVHLFERECSVQRRHQKVVEEAPSPAVDVELRARMGASAVDLVRSLGYLGVGTAEFLLDDSGPEPEFFFLEMNTRLQVEHPVTEEVTGLDLVRLQLEVAAGGHLPFTQKDLDISGHAVEVRLYAEDPADDFAPCPGELLDYGHDPLPGVRYEDGVPLGRSTVSPHYDPMISKVVAKGASRDEAIARLRGALRRMRLHGITTNRDLLLSILESAEFVAGDTHTDFLDRHPDLVAAPPAAWCHDHLAALVAVTALANAALSSAPFALPGFRVLPDVWSPATRYESAYDSDHAVVVRYLFEGSVRSPRLRLRVDEEEHAYGLRHVGADSARVARDGLETTYTVARYDDGSIWVNDPARQSGWRLRKAVDATEQAARSGSATATLPGTVVAVPTAAGQAVEEGDVLVVIEAMKMEHQVLAPRAGLARPRVQVGDFVQAGTVLAEVDASA